MDKDYTIVKIIIVGDSGIGKSCILAMLCEGTFDTLSSPTIGVDFKTKRILVDEHHVKLHLWDTAGLERFRSLTRGYYRNVNAVIFAFDLANIFSLKHLDDWIKEVKSYIDDENVIMMVVGNKCDHQNRISKDIINESFAKYQMEYMKVSAKQNIKIGYLFYKIAERVLMINPTTRYAKSILKLEDKPKKNCCF